MSEVKRKKSSPVAHFSASPNPAEGLSFRLKPHTPTESKLVLKNISGDHAHFKVRIKTGDDQKTRYRVSPNSGTILPNSSATVYVYIEEVNVNSILQRSCDNNNPIVCKDKFLIMGVTMKQEAYEHFIGSDEHAQKKISSILFDSKKHKKSISKLKYDANRFESAYWSKPLNAEQDRRLARGGAEETTGTASGASTDATPTSSSETKATPATEAEASLSTTPTPAAPLPDKKSTTQGETRKATGENQAGSGGNGGLVSLPGDEEVGVEKNSTTPRETATKGADPTATHAQHTSHSTESPNNTTTTTNSSALPASNKAGTTTTTTTTTKSIPASSLPSNVDRGITNGGAMPVEYDNMINDLILLRNKYDSLLVEATKYVAQRDKFQEMFHRSRSEVIRYRELAKGARAEVDASLTDVDRERAVADASNAAAAVAAAAAHSSGKSSGVPVVAVILLTIVAFVIGRFTISYAMMLDEIEEGGGGASEM